MGERRSYDGREAFAILGAAAAGIGAECRGIWPRGRRWGQPAGDSRVRVVIMPKNKEGDAQAAPAAPPRQQ